MENKLINEFIDNVTSSGITGILPKNLEQKWFSPILESSVEFLKIVMKDEETNPESFLNDEKGMILLAAVAELLQYRYDYPAHFQIYSVPKEDIYDSLSCYAIAVVIEEAKRKLNLDLPEISQDNILEKDFITEIEAGNQQLSEFLFETIS